MVIDIYSKGKYPSDALSNFAEHHFVLDGVACASIEGFSFQEHDRLPVQFCRVCGKGTGRAEGFIRSRAGRSKLRPTRDLIAQRCGILAL